MTFLDQIGWFKVVLQERVKHGGPRGLRADWAEYQVREGHRVVSRHSNFFDAQNAAHKLHDAFWDEQARQLREIRAVAKGNT